MRIPQGEFRLDPEFLSNFKARQPEWGPLGYLTYKRTYAADLPDGTSEEFWQTCQRVIEGMFQILEGHCRNYHLPWSADKAQAMAQDAYKRMFAFKWLPPGRGLSKMGTESMRKAGGACLNNCFSGDTEIFVHTGCNSIEVRKLRDCIEPKFVNIVLPGRRYVQANVQSFGTQRLQKVTLAPSLISGYQIEYDVTPDHRWILRNGTSTTALSIGDEILVVPDGMQDSKTNAESYRAGYDDWSRHQAENVGADLFSAVKPDCRNLDYQRGFFEAWVDTGLKLESGNIQVRTADLRFMRWAAKHAPLMGFCVIDATFFDHNGLNYYALTVTEQTASYRVVKISEGPEEEVFCPVVPDENKFMLAHGIVTGNCGFVSTKNIGNKDVENSFSAPFCWLMDMSMLGVGVGFDTKGAGKVTIRKPDLCEPFVVGDSRTGWVDYVRNLFESYVDPNVPFPMADYSEVREKGAKINGFGGTASGPEALVRLTDRTVKLLDALDEKEITSSAIVDLANFLGECVVSGGVRRTAEIGFGKADDYEFVELKDYENNPEARELPRWASNNSVIVNGGPVDFQKLSSYTARNGEPGYLFLENARRFGRMIDPEDHADMNAEGANPCVTKDTIVFTSKGPKSVESLIGNPFTAVVDAEEHPSTDKGFFSTGVKPVYLLTTEEGYSVKVTGNHKILEASALTRKKRYTKWTEARDLKPGDLIVLNNTRTSKGSYTWGTEKEGRADDGWLLGSLLGDGHFYENTVKLEYWGEEKEALLTYAISAIPEEQKRSDMKGHEIKDRDMVTVGSVYVAKLCQTYGIERDKTLREATLLDTSSDFQRGFLRGLFDADGSVQGTQQKGVSVRLGSVTLQHLHVAQKMLLNLGIASTIYKHRKDAGLQEFSGREYHCHASHELVISEDNLQQFQRMVSFETKSKRERLNGLLDSYVRSPNRERFVARVESLTYIGVESVYDCTIPKKHAFDANGIIAHNCNEQTLWDRELCCLVENFPARCDDYEDFAKTLKCSYLYAKVVTMIPTHNPQTNAVMTKNRRIGCSQSGIWDNIHRIGFREHIRWCDQGYREICAIDEEYSNWLGIPKSIKKTSIKPSGTISKLVGAREGIHQAKGEYEIQSIRLNEDSPLIPRLREANIKIETAVYEPNTVVAYFPMHWPGQSERPASMWEQLELAAQMQAYWADNQVSVTVDFDPKTEGPQIGLALEMYASRVKGLSFLPRSAEEHYVQLPKRVCTREEYEEYKESIKDPDFSNLRTHEAEDLFCDGTSCTLPQAKNSEVAATSVNSI
jgi:ribonucleotide reductase class II